MKALMPLAQNYLASDVFRRVEAAPRILEPNSPRPAGQDGLWSEVGFRMRRPLGVLFGILDKLLITRSPAGDVENEIMDVETNRIASEKASVPHEPQPPRIRPPKDGQFAFDFEAAPPPKPIYRHPS